MELQESLKGCRLVKNEENRLSIRVYPAWNFSTIEGGMCGDVACCWGLTRSSIPTTDRA